MAHIPVKIRHSYHISFHHITTNGLPINHIGDNLSQELLRDKKPTIVGTAVPLTIRMVTISVVISFRVLCRKKMRLIVNAVSA